MDTLEKIIRELEKARQEIKHLRHENAQLRKMSGMTTSDPKADRSQTRTSPKLDTGLRKIQRAGDFREHEPPVFAERLPSVNSNSTTQEKIKLFRMLFRARDDVYAVFWSNERTGKKGYSPACEDPWSSRKGKPKKYLLLTDEVILSHLSGERTIGIYPLLRDDTCWFLACDFDKEGWALDAVAFLDVCKDHGVPAYLERSRSGNGAHVWIFFSAPVSATSARQLGVRLLRETMVIRAEIDLASYDRFFPNQDFLPKGGFGNLIALPLQKKCRLLGNTEFLNADDTELHPWPDQWAFLSQIKRLGPFQMEALLEKIPPVTVGPGSTGTVSQGTRERCPAPKQIRCTLGAPLSIEKSGIPPWLLAQIKQLALLHNPQFYERQKLRLSTWRIPRFIKCYEEDAGHIHLPRGTLEDLKELAKAAGSKLPLTDRRLAPERLSLKFLGSLTPQQERAVQMEPIEDSVSRTLLVRETAFTYPGDRDQSIQEIFRGLVKDDERNELIQRDVCRALAQGRRCLILSHWKEHCELLANGLAQSGKTTFVLSGTVGKKKCSAILKSIQDISADKELLIIATGQYLGEGFDCPQVDTLFLAFPFSFKGKLVQYVGRALRSYQGKSSVRVYDYVDSQVTILRKMYARHQKTYKLLRFVPENAQTKDLSEKTFNAADLPLGLFSSDV